MWMYVGALKCMHPSTSCLRLSGGSEGKTVTPAPHSPRPAPVQNRQNKPTAQPQELAFIGVRIDAPALTVALDACLCTPAELTAGGKLLARSDPFSRWPEVEEMLGGSPEDGDEDEGEEEEDEEDEEDGVTRSLESELEAAAAELAAVAISEAAGGGGEGTVWRPGQVYQLQGGAAELEDLMAGIADSWRGGGGGGSSDAAATAGSCLVVVSWYAPWADAGREAAAQLRALAAGYPAVACVEVDATATAANTSLAMAKVMAKSVSMRKATQPVLKSGEKWPAATLHVAPDAHTAIGQFEGAGAGAGLMAALQAQGAVAGAPAPPAAVAAAATAAATGRRKPSAAAAVGQRAVGGGQQMSSASAAVAAAMAAVGRPAAAAVAARKPAGVGLLKRGAADLKSQLAVSGGAPLALLWLDSAAAEEGEGAAASAVQDEWVDAFRGLAATTGAAVFVVADVAASKPNQLLAAALLKCGAESVGQTVPALQLYHENRVVWSLTSAAAAGSGGEAVRKLARQLEKRGGGASGAAAPPVSAGAAAVAAAMAAVGRPGGDKPKSSSKDKSAAKSGQKGAVGGDESGAADQWDPPSGKAAKAGAKRKMGPGKGTTAIYWPRMPCLSCGCPWWLGEDWDARCARCGCDWGALR
jgi:hypothetical protein